MSVSSLLCLVQSRPPQCLCLNESVTFFIYFFGFCFMSFQVQRGPLCFSFKRRCAQGEPGVDWLCPNYRHQRQEGVGILHKRGRFVVALVFRLLSCLRSKFCWKGGGALPGTCTAYDIYSSQRGKCTGGLLIGCPVLGSSHLGTSSYTFHIFPCQQLQHMEQKALCCSQRNIHHWR